MQNGYLYHKFQHYYHWDPNMAILSKVSILKGNLMNKS